MLGLDFGTTNSALAVARDGDARLSRHGDGSTFRSIVYFDPHEAGFDDPTFEYEPVAAAYHYERRLDHDELVLIADFGGGTSDFCLIEVGPTARRKNQPRRIRRPRPCAARARFALKIRETTSSARRRGCRSDLFRLD